jgi:CDP-diacylglycerol--glycerol-3-phosphate 3-phosphatidyltransferase
MTITGALVLVIGLHGFWSSLSGKPLTEERVEREEALPFLGRTPMHAVYGALRPLASACVALGVSANAVTLASLGLAILAATAFATGHFGVGAGFACAGALADAVDGLVARLAGTVSPYGKVLDTTVDRFVDAILLGGIAIYVRHDVVLLVLVLGAIVASSMVSYASAVLRELGLSDRGAPMRRSHRLACLLAGATLTPLAQHLAAEGPLPLRLAPVLLSIAAIAVLGNASAVRRLLGTVPTVPTAPAPTSWVAPR